MAGGTTHGTGTKARHDRLHSEKRLKHLKKRNKQLTNKFIKNQLKKNRRITRNIKAIFRPEILKQWAIKEQLIAKKELKERKIKQSTFLCRMIAIDALYTKKMPKNAVRIKKGVVFNPPKKGILSKQQKKDIFEKLNEMETKKFNRKEAVKKQTEKLEKRLPKTA